MAEAPLQRLARQLTSPSLLDAAAAEASAEALASAAAAAESADSRASPNAPPAQVFDIFVAGVTDPGVPGKQNQDEFFTWQSEGGQDVVVAVLDGHGRELGHLAARVARDSLRGTLTTPAALAALAERPGEVLEAAFSKAHADIESAFRKVYEDGGWLVERAPEGYLLRSQPQAAAPANGRALPSLRAGASSGGGTAPVSAPVAPLCVHGGTTATIVIILQGRRLIVSNVGDSTALVCGLGSAAGALRSADEWKPLPGSQSQALPRPQLPPQLGGVPPHVADSFLEVSADHSPESVSEFQRMHRFRPHPSLKHHPELFFVYDTLTQSKLSCPPIFEVSQATGEARKTDAGTYYKNVRSEWASLVATPPHAGFQDALAFTRSLGDLHLQSYGVSHTPETMWMDLTTLAADSSFPLPELAAAAASAPVQVLLESPLAAHPVAICVSSDGVWDNYVHVDVASFLLAQERVDAAVLHKSAEAACVALMADNLNRARHNFGSSADNMTAIVLYLVPKTQEKDA